MPSHPYQDHLRSSDDLVTSYEATRAGFVALALEKNRRSTVSVKHFPKRNILRTLSSSVQRLRRKWQARYGINWKGDCLPMLLI